MNVSKARQDNHMYAQLIRPLEYTHEECILMKSVMKSVMHATTISQLYKYILSKAQNNNTNKK